MRLVDVCACDFFKFCEKRWKCSFTFPVLNQCDRTIVLVCSTSTVQLMCCLICAVFTDVKLFYVNWLGVFWSVPDTVYANAIQDNLNVILYPGLIEELVDIIEITDNCLVVCLSTVVQYSFTVWRCFNPPQRFQSSQGFEDPKFLFALGQLPSATVSVVLTASRPWYCRAEMAQAALLQSTIFWPEFSGTKREQRTR